MSFLWPRALWMLLVVPLAAYAYVRLVRTGTAQRAALGTMGELWAAGGRRPGRRRHLAAALFLAGITVLIVGAARPEATVDLPHREGTVILAFDVSASMTADDLVPTRLQAAKRAARAFVDEQPSNIEIGVVAFNTAAFEVQAPTDDRAEVRDAIGRLRPEGGTSLGRGIAASLSSIADEPVVPEDGSPDAGASGGGRRVKFLGSSAVILMSDGEDTTGLDPVEVAQVAADAGVRVHTVGLGSEAGAVIDVDGFSVATQLDEAVLREIAGMSNGTYHRAEDAEALAGVYDDIDLRLTVRGERTEVTALFAGAALVLFLVAGALSLWWFGRVP
ncbi:MAG: membrane protein [Acidimicrobiia bacterium]